MRKDKILLLSGIGFFSTILIVPGFGVDFGNGVLIGIGVFIVILVAGSIASRGI